MHNPTDPRFPPSLTNVRPKDTDPTMFRQTDAFGRQPKVSARIADYDIMLIVYPKWTPPLASVATLRVTHIAIARSVSRRFPSYDLHKEIDP